LKAWFGMLQQGGTSKDWKFWAGVFSKGWKNALQPTRRHMKELKRLFDKNREWAEQIGKEDPEFFEQLSKQQNPEYLWIGCADSRVPANEIVNLPPGEVFVHRNIANVVVHTDLNCLSVIQYAVEELKVKHIIVCGHYGCGGVKAALDNRDHGLIDNWLRHIRDVYRLHAAQLDAIVDSETRRDRLCELNVIEQVANVCDTTMVRNAWKRGQELTIHGWIYRLEDGLLRDLDVCTTCTRRLPE
jgi:carbonic anhydrase